VHPHREDEGGVTASTCMFTCISHTSNYSSAVRSIVLEVSNIDFGRACSLARPCNLSAQDYFILTLAGKNQEQGQGLSMLERETDASSKWCPTQGPAHVRACVPEPLWVCTFGRDSSISYVAVSVAVFLMQNAMCWHLFFTPLLQLHPSTHV